MITPPPPPLMFEHGFTPLSDTHPYAQRMEDAAHAEPGTSKAEVCLKLMQTSTFNRLKILYITCHGLARHARPFTDFSF